MQDLFSLIIASLLKQKREDNSEMYSLVTKDISMPLL